MSFDKDKYMKTKIWIILIITTLAGAYFYTYSKDTVVTQAEVTQSQIKESVSQNNVETPEPSTKYSEEAPKKGSTVDTTNSEPTQNTDQDIVKLIDSLEKNGALDSNEIFKLMSDPEGFDQALYKLEESYYEPEYSYETKVKYQHFFNTSPFHLQGKAQLNNLQCSPKMCLAKVTGLKNEERFKYPQTIQSSEDLPIKALAVGVSGDQILLAFSTDPEVNAIMTRKESDE